MRALPYLVAALATLPAACAGGPASEGGPLARDEARGTLCVPVDPESAMTMGQDILVNSGESDLTITDVALEEAEGVSLVEAFVTPLDERTTVGVMSGFPPEGLPDESQRAWARREPAEQATVPARATRGLVAGLRLDGSRGSAKAFIIEYRVGDREYRYRTPNEMILRASCGG